MQPVPSTRAEEEATMPLAIAHSGTWIGKAEL